MASENGVSPPVVATLYLPPAVPPVWSQPTNVSASVTLPFQSALGTQTNPVSPSAGSSSALAQLADVTALHDVPSLRVTYQVQCAWFIATTAMPYDGAVLASVMCATRSSTLQPQAANEVGSASSSSIASVICDTSTVVSTGATFSSTVTSLVVWSVSTRPERPKVADTG